ncbi:hypothetical protein JQX08_07330 [Pseudomonas sp. UL073]|uniref:Uncharacterized protein n=1 Tax=Zestomonas insulae TaxID=2809017 RepID=A0ABS2IBN6_9GAMM|nr:hypothetical protein [Pseudomonas insulae]MBM7060516.1 hypothetical protein [Pseudomonas insulae]
MRQNLCLLAGSLLAASSTLAGAAAASDAQLVSEATGGRLTALKGQYYEESCSAAQDYDAEVVDLNQDGQPEVFTQIHGICLGGGAGVLLELYIKGRDGQWHGQFGFPGMYNVLTTKHQGYPDIEIGGPGTCFPVWRWNGQSYALHKPCPL